MSKIILSFLVFSLLGCISLQAKNCKLDIGAGYRRDNLKWELAGPENAPPVMSRLTWSGLDIFEMTALFKKITHENIYMRASGDWGWITRGKNRDSDYRVGTSSSSSEEYSRTDNDGGKGDVWDGSLAVGYFMRGVCGFFEEIRFAPLIGYSIHEQHLQMFNGFQTIDLDRPDFEGHHIHRLDSTYRTKWLGPWAGVDLYYHWNDCITINGSFEYHWMKYNAKGHWNLRRELLGDFHHEGDGHGYFLNLGIDYNFINGWYLGAQIKYNYAHVRSGKEHSKIASDLAPGIQPASLRKSATSATSSSSSREEKIGIKHENKLRNVKWDSFSFLFTIGYNF